MRSCASSTCGPYDVATSAPRIVENFLDLAHFGFVHEGWLGDRSHVALDDYRVQSTATRDRGDRLPRLAAAEQPPVPPKAAGSTTATR